MFTSKPVLQLQAAPSAGKDPVFACSIRNSVSQLICCSEVLLGTGLARCDLLLPAHDVIKLGLAPLRTFIQTSYSQFGPAFRARQFDPVYLEFVFVDEAGKEYPRGCDLEVWANDEDYNALISRHPPMQLSPLPTDSAIMRMQRLSPIKFLEGSTEGFPILGLGGVNKLKISYASSRNEISMLDKENRIDNYFDTMF